MTAVFAVPCLLTEPAVVSSAEARQRGDRLHAVAHHLG